MKIKKITLLCLLSLGFIACNSEWEDEVYTNYIGLKAPINSVGVTNIYLPYEENGEVIYNLPVIVGGSQMSGKDLDVRLEVDNDTLAILNEARYKQRKDLWYYQLDAKHYEFPSPTCHISADSCVGLFNIKFKFKDLDLMHKWVLPLAVAQGESYQPNPRKHYSKALLRIMPYNDYSGVYSGTDMRIYIENTTTNPVTLAKRMLYVVNQNSVFFYAGDISENLPDRDKYKIQLDFNNDGTLTAKALNDKINFLPVNRELVYETRIEKDETRPYIERHYTTIRLKYYYDDITTYGEEHPINYRVEGSMIMQRTINTLKPERDQIEW